jgi:hypothetical protein
MVYNSAIFININYINTILPPAKNVKLLLWTPVAKKYKIILSSHANSISRMDQEQEGKTNSSHIPGKDGMANSLIASYAQFIVKKVG